MAFIFRRPLYFSVINSCLKHKNGDHHRQKCENQSAEQLSAGCAALEAVDGRPELAHTVLRYHHMLVFAVGESAHFDLLIAKLHGACNGSAQSGMDFGDIRIRDDRFHVSYRQLATSHYRDSSVRVLY